MLDSRLVSDVQTAEGCKLQAYKDTMGFWTVGYGHKLDSSRDWTGYQISALTANALLTSDLSYAQESAENLPEWTFLNTPCRRNAITELVFNMGAAKWRNFAKCRYDIQQSDWQGAHDELLDSLWATQVGPTRSQRLALYLLSGNYT